MYRKMMRAKSSMVYRSKDQIVAEMLTYLASEGATMKQKTRVMYKAILSYAQYRKYLAMLEVNGFVTVTNDGCKITEKGLTWLKQYQKLAKLDYTKEEA